MQIEFNDQKYSVKTLLSLVGFGRQEVVNTSDLSANYGSAYPGVTPVCYQHAGVLYVLVGNIKEDVDQQQVCILSKHILKKALVTESAVSTPVYAPQFRRVAAPASQDERVRLALQHLGAGVKQNTAAYNEMEVDNRVQKALAILEATINRNKYSD